MASEGPLTAGTGANDASAGTTAWTNASNVTASDNTYATCAQAMGGNSQYLLATNFGFAIPSGATIDGIVVEWERALDTGALCYDQAVRIVKGGSIGTTDKSNVTVWGAEAFQSYGTGTTDLWGETWTDTDINASTFGAALRTNNNVGLGTPKVDSCRITVYYTAAAVPQTPTTTVRRDGVQYHSIDMNTSSDLLTALAGSRLRVVGLVMVAANTVTAKFQSGASSDITGAMTLVAGRPYILKPRKQGYFQTVAGEKLNLVLGSGVQVSGTLAYETV